MRIKMVNQGSHVKTPTLLINDAVHASTHYYLFELTGHVLFYYNCQYLGNKILL
jgi:hypothetical protein